MLAGCQGRSGDTRGGGVLSRPQVAVDEVPIFSGAVLRLVAEGLADLLEGVFVWGEEVGEVG